MASSELLSQADWLCDNGKTLEAINIYRRVYSMSLGNKDFQSAGGALQMIGVCYKIDNDTKSSILWLKKAIILYKKHGLTEGVGNTLRDIGITYEYVNKLKLAKKYLLESEKTLKGSKDLGGYAITCAKLGLVEMRLKNYNEAEILIDKGIELARLAKHWFFEATALWHKAELEAETKQFEKAIKSLDQAKKIFNRHASDGHKRRLSQISGLKSFCFARLNQTQECFSCLTEFSRLAFSEEMSQPAVSVIIRDVKLAKTLGYLAKK